MVDSGCCSGTLVRQRLIDLVRALRFFYSMFWDSVPCIRSIPMHCFLDGVRVGRSSTSRQVFWTFRRLPSRCCGSLFLLCCCGDSPSCCCGSGDSFVLLSSELFRIIPFNHCALVPARGLPSPEESTSYTRSRADCGIAPFVNTTD